MIYRAGNHETFNGGSRRHSPFGIRSKSGEIRVSLFTVGMKVNVLKATITGDLFKNYATSRSVIPVQDKISKVPVVPSSVTTILFLIDILRDSGYFGRKKSRLSPVLLEKILFFRYLSQKHFFFCFYFIFFQITWS